MKNILITVIIFIFYGCPIVLSQDISIDSVKIIKIEKFKYDFSITGIRLKYNDTITIISNNSICIKNAVKIKVNRIYSLKLTKMLNDTILSSIPPMNFRLRAKDKRTLWDNKRAYKLIPYKALNLEGLNLK